MGDIDRVVISFDPSTGKFEFSAPSEQLEKASEQAQILIKTVNACLLPEERRKPQVQDPPARDAVTPATAKAAQRTGKKSGDRAGRIGSFEKVDFGLTEAQERAIHDFYTTRRPKEQALQTVVAIYIGAKIIGRASFEYNEIYTLLHLGGERELPKALDVVMGGLLGDNWVAKTGKQFSLKFLATDYVEKLSSEAN